MIDLHLHLLPSIDDGSRSIRESGEMLARFAQLGYTRLVVTPHLEQAPTEQRSAEIDAALGEVQELARDLGVMVDLGFEHVLTLGAIERLGNGEPTRLANSRAALVELPAFTWSGYTEAMLFELQVAGIEPVLAHPERYRAVQDHPGLALDIAERGVVLQLTTAALAGALGSEVRRTARGLLQESLERQLLVVVSSDAHSVGRRLSQLADGLEWVRNHFSDGDAIVDWVTRRVPSAVLATSPEADGAVLEHLRRSTPPAGRSRRRGWFW